MDSIKTGKTTKTTSVVKNRPIAKNGMHEPSAKQEKREKKNLKKDRENPRLGGNVDEHC